MFSVVDLPMPIALVPGRPLEGKLRRLVDEYPGMPRGVSEVVAELNTRPQGVAARVEEPWNGGDRSLLLYSRDYVVRLFESRSGDAYTVAAVNPLRLTDHDRLAQGCLLLRADWHAVFELRAVREGFHAQWEHVQSRWAELVKQLGDRRESPALSDAQTAYLDTLTRVIDATQRIGREKVLAAPTYPYREIAAVGERRFSGAAHYAFTVVGDRLPEREQFVAVRTDLGPRGQVIRIDDDRVVVRFDEPVDWGRLPRQGELEETTNGVVHAKRREAVKMLRTRESRHPTLLSVLVENRVQPLRTVQVVPREGLDEDQLTAFRRSLGVQDLMLVLGPPGTGKTRTICEIALAQALDRSRGPVLVASHTNRAVDNVLAKLPSDVVVVRVGNEGKVDREAVPFLLEQLAADLRGEVIGSVAGALRGYAGLQTAGQWVPELDRRTEALGEALRNWDSANSELDRLRRAAGGPAQARVTELSADAARQGERVVRQNAKIDRALRRDGRARARRWWPPFRAWARAAARGRARRIGTLRARAAEMTEVVNQVRAAVADAEAELVAVTRDAPEVRAATAAAAEVQQQIVRHRAGVVDAVQLIGAALAPVDTLPFPFQGDAVAVLGAARSLHAGMGQRLARLKARAALLESWHAEVSGSVEQLYPELIRYADVIGATCVGAASRREIAGVEFDLAIVDEAGQIGTADLLVPLVRAKRAVLVGDHRQLPPVVEHEVADWAAETADGDVAALLSTSALELLVGRLPDSHIVQLTRQRRMPEVIADFVSDMFYDGMLRTEVVRTHDASLFASPLAFVDTCRLPERQRAESPAVPGNRRSGWVNHVEAKLLVLLAERYHRRGAEWALIVPYAAQKKLISEQLLARIHDADAIAMSVGTVDSFQGGERDVILYGFTRSNSDGRIGFLDELRRANVAFTRAKRQLVLVGDMKMLLRADDARFRELAHSLRDHIRATGDVHQAADFAARLEGLRD